MAIVAKFDDNVIITGRLVPNTITPGTDGWASNAAIKQNAAVAGSKLVRQHRIQFAIDDGTSISNHAHPVFYLNGSAGVLQGVSAAVNAAITGTGSIEIEVTKSTGGGGFAEVTQGLLILSAADAARTPKSVGVDSTAGALVAGDILLLTITGVSSPGSPGLIVHLEIDETP